MDRKVVAFDLGAENIRVGVWKVSNNKKIVSDAEIIQNDKSEYSTKYIFKCNLCF